mmetsp:Transcript_45366/g.145525  ORF Transcript_45366/g.145525 Transcript_45366/m.145525 type:complete len:240 (+) Transcript_45366:484-1203(+)
MLLPNLMLNSTWQTMSPGAAAGWHVPENLQQPTSAHCSRLKWSIVQSSFWVCVGTQPTPAGVLWQHHCFFLRDQAVSQFAWALLQSKGRVVVSTFAMQRMAPLSHCGSGGGAMPWPCTQFVSGSFAKKKLGLQVVQFSARSVVQCSESTGAPLVQVQVFALQICPESRWKPSSVKQAWQMLPLSVWQTWVATLVAVAGTPIVLVRRVASMQTQTFGTQSTESFIPSSSTIFLSSGWYPG